MDTLTLIQSTANQTPPKVFAEPLMLRLSALNDAERKLRDIGITVLDRQLAGFMPHITVQFVPGGMTRLLNRVREMQQRDGGDCLVVSGRFEDVVVVWAVPK